MDRWERFLKTDRCCCGCVDLPTSCLMWAWVDIIGGTLMIFGFFSGSMIQLYCDFDTVLFSAVLGFITSGCLVYGIFHNKPIFLLPEVICNIVILFSIPIYILVVAFDEDRDKDEIENLNQGWSLGRVHAIVVLILFEVLMWHKASVTYSLFKHMKDGEVKPNLNAGVEYQTNLVPQNPGLNA